MKLLFNDSLFPLTSELGLLEVDVTTAISAYIEWTNRLQQARGVTLDITQVKGNLETVLRHILPFTSPESVRQLWVPTASNWSAFFMNGAMGNDVVSPIGHLSKTIGCRGLRVTAIPDTINRGKRTGRYGAMRFEIWGPEKTDWLNIIRSVSVIHDTKWIFDEMGTRFPFEKIEKYSFKSKKDRLTFEILDEYVRAFGVPVFDEDFYMPSGSEATLVERHGEVFNRLRKFNLEEIQRRLEAAR